MQTLKQMQTMGLKYALANNRGAPITSDHQWSPAQAHKYRIDRNSHYSASPQRLATSATQSEQCLSQASSAARGATSTAPRHKKMFGPRRGYDAIGEPSVSNADKPRVQPVKVDPKAIKHMELVQLELAPAEAEVRPRLMYCFD